MLYRNRLTGIFLMNWFWYTKCHHTSFSFVFLFYFLYSYGSFTHSYSFNFHNFFRFFGSTMTSLSKEKKISKKIQVYNSTNVLYFLLDLWPELRKPASNKLENEISEYIRQDSESETRISIFLGMVDPIHFNVILLYKHTHNFEVYIECYKKASKTWWPKVKKLKKWY